MACVPDSLAQLKPQTLSVSLNHAQAWAENQCSLIALAYVTVELRVHSISNHAACLSPEDS